MTLVAVGNTAFESFEAKTIAAVMLIAVVWNQGWLGVAEFGRRPDLSKFRTYFLRVEFGT